MTKELDKNYEELAKLKYKVWRLDQFVMDLVWKRDKRCCRCTKRVKRADARPARITSPNNFNNRFNPDLIALCCPFCEEHCIIETEFALVKLYQQNPDFPYQINMKYLDCFDEKVKPFWFDLKRQRIESQLNKERNYIKNLVAEALEDAKDAKKTMDESKTPKASADKV